MYRIKSKVTACFIRVFKGNSRLEEVVRVSSSSVRRVRVRVRNKLRSVI